MAKKTTLIDSTYESEKAIRCALDKLCAAHMGAAAWLTTSQRNAIVTKAAPYPARVTIEMRTPRAVVLATIGDIAYRISPRAKITFA